MIQKLVKIGSKLGLQWRWLKSEKRVGTRMALRNDKSVRVVLLKPNLVIDGRPLEISTGGMSFISRSVRLNIGDEVEVTVRLDEGLITSYRGQIHSQVVYYPSATQDLKHATFRFSICFDRELDTTIINRLMRDSHLFLEAS